MVPSWWQTSGPFLVANDIFVRAPTLLLSAELRLPLPGQEQVIVLPPATSLNKPNCRSPVAQEFVMLILRELVNSS